MIDPDELLSIPQIIKAKGLTRTSVHRAMNRGDLPPVVIGGRQFVQRSDVERFIPRAYAGREGSKPVGRAGRQARRVDGNASQ